MKWGDPLFFINSQLPVGKPGLGGTFELDSFKNILDLFETRFLISVKNYVQVVTVANNWGRFTRCSGIFNLSNFDNLNQK